MISTLLASAGRTVALVEELRVGGECPYVACMPSKAMLRSARLHHEAAPARQSEGVPTTSAPADDDAAFLRAVHRRDEITEHGDDTRASAELQSSSIELVRGRRCASSARASWEWAVASSGWTDLVIAAGSRPVAPDIEGLDGAPTWTSDQALSASFRPSSVLVMGGGPVGCELAQVFARFGTTTTLVEAGPQLAGREQPQVAERLARVLEGDGIDVRLDTTVLQIESSEVGARASLSDGTSVDVERIIIATGRRPTTDDLGLEGLGIRVDDHGAISVDDHCRVAGRGHRLRLRGTSQASLRSLTPPTTKPASSSPTFSARIEQPTTPPFHERSTRIPLSPASAGTQVKTLPTTR